MRVQCSTELSLGPFACKENSDENAVLDRIVPEAMSLGRTRKRMKCSTELSLGTIDPGENSDDCFFGDMTCEGRYSSRMVVFQKNGFRAP